MRYYLRYNAELVPLLTQMLAEVEPGQPGAGTTNDAQHDGDQRGMGIQMYD